MLNLYLNLTVCGIFTSNIFIVLNNVHLQNINICEYHKGSRTVYVT